MEAENPAKADLAEAEKPVKANTSFFITIDQGTSGTKALLFSKEGKLIQRYDEKHEQYYPQPGWVEHDPEEIFQHTVSAVKTVVRQAGLDIRDAVSISLSNQRETVIMWDRRTGKPVMNAIVWQCSRAEGICAELQKTHLGENIQKKTGLVLSPYFSAAKARWIVEHHLADISKDEKRHYLFGTVDSYLIWKLTGGAVHAADFSNAGRTQLFNIHTLSWDEELLEIFKLEKEMMPEVKSSNAVFGYTEEGLFETVLPIAGVLGDSHAAFFGQCCTRKGMAKATYGTGSSVMMHVGTEPVTAEHVVTSIGYSLDEEVVYVLEGNINCTGAVIKWLKDDLELIRSSKEAGEIAASIDSAEGVYLVPAFVGLSAPYWNSDARAAIVNLSRGTKKAHIVRAAEEAIAYQIKDVVQAMQQESGIELKELRVDGGPTKDDFLMQFQADILGVEVVRNSIEELSATGAMYMSGLALGVWNSLEEIEEMRELDKSFSSHGDTSWVDKCYAGWKAAVENVLKAKKFS